MKKLLVVCMVIGLAISSVFAGGGNDGEASGGGKFSSSDSKYTQYNDQLSKPVKLFIYMLGDTPTDLKVVIDAANKQYFQPILNCSIELVFLAWSDYQTLYPLVLTGGEDVDIIFTAPWAFYEQEAAKGSFVEITDELLTRWMPNIKAATSKIAWMQTLTNGKRYAFPTLGSGDHYKYPAIRDDLRIKYNLPEPKDWDSMESYLFTIAAREPSIQAYAAPSEAPEVFQTYFEYINVLLSEDPISFAWKNVNRQEPGVNDLFFTYTSDWYRDFALEMAQWAQNGVWSRNVMNNTVSQGDSFTQGKSASVFWNMSIYNLGETMERNGVGKAGYYDLSPNTPARKETYANNMWAIAASSKNKERAMLALDLMKTNDALVRLLQGGFDGRHYISTPDGRRTLGPDAEKYGYNNWGWALNSSASLDLALGPDASPQRIANEAAIAAKLFEPKIDGFRVDQKSFQSEWAVIAALIAEYRPSFECGVFGNQTQAKFNEFKSKIEAAGIAKVTAEFKRQYTEFLRNN